VAALAVDLGRFERGLRQQGFAAVAGADEVGRGAIAGPLVAASVILPDAFDLEGIADSKVLTRLQRERAYERIVAGAVALSVGKVTPARIDRRGLHRSNLWLLRRTVCELPIEPDYVLTDGFPVRRMQVPALAMRKGDAVAGCIAAASIVAKVTRDRMMDRYARRFRAYGFERNRGYGTREHWDALDRVGPSPIHRLSFKGVSPESRSERVIVEDEWGDR
jgi:ribonuclease HII